MGQQKKFQCIRDWRRHSKGTVISEWEWKKLPSDIQTKHFQEVTQDEIQTVATPTQTLIELNVTDSSVDYIAPDNQLNFKFDHDESNERPKRKNHI